MSYHHHYHYGSDRYRNTSRIRIQYNCGVCGLNATAINQVPKCAGCSRPICNTDNHFGYCKQHYDELTPEDQLKVQNYENKLELLYKKNKKIVFLPILWIPIQLISLSVSIHSNSFISIYLITTFGLLALFILAIALVNIKSRKNMQQIMEESKEITNNYKFSRVQIKPNQSNLQYKGSQEISVGNKILCPRCGYDNKDENAQFCNGCGSKLA